MTGVIDRTITKSYGVLFGTAAILAAIWLFPEYQDAISLGYLRDALLPFLVFTLPASLIVIFFTELILGEKHDGTYQFGLLARFQFRRINWNIFLDGVLEWLVRCIFLLINFFSASIFLARIRTNGLPDPSDGFVNFVAGLDGVLFALILFSILPGYIFASRLIGTELKKIDRTWFGWAVTLSSYSPLNAAIFTSWATYVPVATFSGPIWVAITEGYAPLLYLVGVVIILAGAFHLWAEATMGIRSANLSSRGVITTGPFAITKHPVYVSKCVQWAFIYLPILNAIGFLSALRSGILFFFVCVIFAARSLAEEKLLATDEKYVQYALYMDKKSAFAFVGKIVPLMSFKWRYDFWKKNGYL